MWWIGLAGWWGWEGERAMFSDDGEGEDHGEGLFDFTTWDLDTVD